MSASDKKKNLSQEDKDIWENYLKNPKDIFDKEKNNLKQGKIKGRFKFDLHGFTLDDANKKVREIIHYCIENGHKELLLITGKGLHSNNDQDAYTSKNLGKLRYSIPEFIKTDSELSGHVISITEAASKEGGEGAVLIKLKSL